MKAKKYDNNKPMYHTAPTYGIEEMIKVFTYGANKYGAFNHHDGIEYCRYVNAAVRHINDYLQGEDIDESGLPHLAHAAASLLIVVESMKLGLGEDDRNPKYLENEAKKD